MVNIMKKIDENRQATFNTLNNVINKLNAKRDRYNAYLERIKERSDLFIIQLTYEKTLDHDNSWLQLTPTFNEFPSTFSKMQVKDYFQTGEYNLTGCYPLVKAYKASDWYTKEIEAINESLNVFDPWYRKIENDL